MDDFQNKLKLISSHSIPDALVEYEQGRFELIYPSLYRLEIDSVEKLELTKTLEQLELLNNKKKLFSEYEDQFSRIYQAFVKKGKDTSNLHDYFRSLVRGDQENAKQIADLILSTFEESKREIFSKLSGIHPSHSHFWKDFKKTPEINTELIRYSDHQNTSVVGFKGKTEKDAQSEKFKFIELSKSMEDIHGVQIVSVPEAIEKLSSNGFSTREASLKPYHMNDSEMITSPMIVIPEKDLLYNRVSSTAKHEARHAYYATERQQFSTSPFDVSVHSINKKPLGELRGYQSHQSYEEVSTHSKDLMNATRTGNREILKLYQKNNTLLTNEVFDLAFLHNKTKTVIKISEQTAKTALESIAEIKTLMKAKYSDAMYLTVTPSKEGYIFSFPVNDSFLVKVTFSSKSEKKVIKNFVDDYLDFQATLKIAEEKGIAVSEDKIKVYTDAINSAFKLAEEKLSRSILIAKQTKADAEKISVLLEEINQGNVKMDQKRYLEIRSIISKPARRVTGLSIKDPEEYQKAIEAIRVKRKARK